MTATYTTPESDLAEQLPARAARPPRRRRLAALLTAVAATALAGGSLATTAAPAQAATLSPVTSVVDGGHYTLGYPNSGLVLDNPSSSTTDGTVPVGWQPNGGFNQVWKFAAAGDGYYKIINNASGKCLDLLGGTGTTVGQYLCDPNGVDQPNQLWLPVLVGGAVFELRLKLNDKPLSLTHQNGSIVASVGGQASRWQLSPTLYSVTTAKYSLREGRAATDIDSCDGYDPRGGSMWKVRMQDKSVRLVAYEDLSDVGMKVSIAREMDFIVRVSYDNTGRPAQRREGQIRFYCDPKGF